ncbi:hypothetical protein FSP39_025478 [Pinctada imbricata]|uniref:EF-hand domain-containing protein n=1 Tax=Pinctada imbricata TaxID=66713 RepID=A0AA89C5B1_PINIB|nr:hypothetical protein FSP39_025478 [Pinctada imbricata]
MRVYTILVVLVVLCFSFGDASVSLCKASSYADSNQRNRVKRTTELEKRQAWWMMGGQKTGSMTEDSFAKFILDNKDLLANTMFLFDNDRNGFISEQGRNKVTL